MFNSLHLKEGLSGGKISFDYTNSEEPEGKGSAALVVTK